MLLYVAYRSTVNKTGTIARLCFVCKTERACELWLVHFYIYLAQIHGLVIWTLYEKIRHSSSIFPIPIWFALKSKKKNEEMVFLLLKLFWPTARKNCSSDQEKLLKFEAEGREFAKILRSLEQFIQTVKGQKNFW